MTKIVRIIAQERLLHTMSNFSGNLQQICEQHPNLGGAANVGEPFQGLDTEWMQNKFFREKFKLVEPFPAKLGERVIVKNDGSTVTCSADSYYVPFLRSIQKAR